MKKFIPVVALSGLLFVIGFISTSVRNNNIVFAAPPCTSCQKTAVSGKKQSRSKKICSAITGILKNEIGKTKNKTKLDILKSGLDYANDVCDSGGSPDLAKITKGLPEKDKARISQKTNAALFDGVADRPDKDFGPNTTRTAATLTGTGGQVTDLKSFEPNTPKFSQVTEFSLASAKTAVSPQKDKQVSASDIDPTYVGGWCCNGVYMEASSEADKNRKCCNAYSACCTSGGGGGTGSSFLDKLKAALKKLQESAKTLKDWASDKYHELKGDKKCGEAWYSPKTQCCTSGKMVGEKCGEDCYVPNTECCEDGKKDENCEKKCARIYNRIKAVEKFLAGYSQGIALEQTDPTATPIARTRCLPGIGPWTRYYSGFKTLDLEVQDGIIVHENVHRHQCETLGWLDFPEPEVIREPPAFEAERAFLNSKYKGKCGSK